MDYNKKFDFYLLSSSGIFEENLSKFDYEGDIVSYNKKDFEPIIDAALKANLFTEGNLYNIKEQLKALAVKEKNAQDIEEKIENIFMSHMGAPLLYELYCYSLPDAEKKKIEKKIDSIIEVNNTPIRNHVFKKTINKGFFDK